MTKYILGGVITVVVACIVAATGWIFASVASMPEGYIQKKDFKTYIERNYEEHQRINDKLDRIIEKIYEGD
jgi:hypothetical protein